MRYVTKSYDFRCFDSLLFPKIIYSTSSKITLLTVTLF